jgi:TPR repeat protein
MRRKILLIIILFFARFAAAADTEPTDLEKMFETGRYPEFLLVASPLAQKGNADAQFLLGKAYHLGRGVDADYEQARHFYTLAAKQDNARALNNLGLIELRQDAEPRLALQHFERAMALGLRIGAANVRRARTQLCDDYSNHDECAAAGEAYVSAWQTDKNNNMLEGAIHAYAVVCGASRNDDSSVTTSAIDCQRAIELAETGAALGLPKATFNRGAIDYYRGRYDEALKWFILANDRGMGLAAYMLGNMYEKGEGVSKDGMQALAWFKRAASLKEERAFPRVSLYWATQIDQTFDPALINEAVAELAKIQPQGWQSKMAQFRLALPAALNRNAAQFPVLAKETIQDVFCPANVEFAANTEWSMVAVARPEDVAKYIGSLPKLAHGRADSKGCLTLSSEALLSLREALARGETPLLSWPDGRYLLKLEHDSQGANFFLLDTAVLD